ncbi:MAG: hypothetical protein WD100_10225, partial [Tistlia sp.]
MGKTYRAWEVDQRWLLPPSVHEFVAADHPAHLVREIVRVELDLSAVLAPYERELRGYPPYLHRPQPRQAPREPHRLK